MYEVYYRNIEDEKRGDRDAYTWCARFFAVKPLALSIVRVFDLVHGFHVNAYRTYWVTLWHLVHFVCFVVPFRRV